EETKAAETEKEEPKAVETKKDNNCTVEFDAFGFSVKDFLTRHILLICDSSGDLYPVTQPSLTPHALVSVSTTTCTKPSATWEEELRSHWFGLLPIVSSVGFKVLFVILDHYVAMISFQCDHGGEFDNNNLLNLFSQNGIQMRFSCPKTSQQNGKSKRMIQTINNVIRTLLFTSPPPPSFWVEALDMAVLHDDAKGMFLLKEICLWICGVGHVDFSISPFTRQIFSNVGQQNASYACPSGASYRLLLKRDLRSFVDGLLSVAEAEYRGVCEVVAETAWIRNLYESCILPCLLLFFLFLNEEIVVYMPLPKGVAEPTQPGCGPAQKQCTHPFNARGRETPIRPRPRLET
ncbi:ribonuclease H-like domain-containing protein, partial [Tanacetum coccineum]